MRPPGRTPVAGRFRKESTGGQTRRRSRPEGRRTWGGRARTPGRDAGPAWRLLEADRAAGGLLARRPVNLERVQPAGLTDLGEGQPDVRPEQNHQGPDPDGEPDA